MSLLQLPMSQPLLVAILSTRALPGTRQGQHGEGRGEGKEEEKRGKGKGKGGKKEGEREKEKRGKGRVTRAPKRFTHGEEKQKEASEASYAPGRELRRRPSEAEAKAAEP